MSSQELAAALERASAVMRRRPEAGLHDDAVATARWAGGTRAVSHHANGKRVVTDMAQEVGGSGDEVSPGWLLRSGVAACTLTCIAMDAARAGIALRSLDVVVTSRSDIRGWLHVPERDGTAVYAGPRDFRMQVDIAADGVDDERLQQLVEAACKTSPMARTVLDALPMALDVRITSTSESG